MKLITDSSDPRFQELSEIWGPAVHSKDMIERNGAIAIAWLMESARVALSRAEKTERELDDEKQKVKNLEEYMLKGVAFRDELQARLCVVTDALTLIEHATDPNSFDDGGGHENAYDIAHEALAGPPRICRHAEEAKRLRACIGTMRGTIRDDLTPENIVPGNAERYTVEIGDAFRALRAEVDRLQTNECAIADERFDMERRLTARAEKAEGALCRAREAFGRFLRFFAAIPDSPPGPPLVPRSHNHKILG